MLKRDLEKEIERLKKRIETLEQDNETYAGEINEVHDNYCKQMDQMQQDFNRYNDYAMARAIMNKNDELHREIDQLKKDLEFYQNKDASDMEKYIQKLERHIAQYSMGMKR